MILSYVVYVNYLFMSIESWYFLNSIVSLLMIFFTKFFCRILPSEGWKGLDLVNFSVFNVNQATSGQSPLLITTLKQSLINP